MGLDIKAVNYWEECFVGVADATPTFLRPVVGVILLAGKSMHLIESIGKLKHIQEGVVHSSPSKGGVARKGVDDVDGIVSGLPISLYQEFLAKVQPQVVESCDGSCDTAAGGGVAVGEGWRVSALGHFHPVMDSYLKMIKKVHCSSPPNNRGVQEVLQVPKSSSIPLNLVIQECLYPLLQSRHLTVGGASGWSLFLYCAVLLTF